MHRSSKDKGAHLTLGCTRRAVLVHGVAAGALATLGLQRAAAAETWPARPVVMIVAFPPGGATDILARTLGQHLGERIGQQIIVENKPGAGSTIGLEAAAKAAPDGYTLFLSALTNQAIAQHLYPERKASISGDFVPISLLANGAHILVVHPSVPARTMGEFIAWLKANSGKVSYGSQGTGTLSHLEAEMLRQRLDVQLLHVPYKGSSNAYPDLIAGRVSFMFDSVAASMPHVKSGALRPLGVAATQRVPAYPDLPTIAESGVTGYDVDNWFALYAPKNTPAAVVSRLDAEAATVLKQPDLDSQLLRQGYVVDHAGPTRLAELTAHEVEKWARVIASVNVKV